MSHSMRFIYDNSGGHVSTYFKVYEEQYDLEYQIFKTLKLFFD